jgi:hypothetical protein
MSRTAIRAWFTGWRLKLMICVVSAVVLAIAAVLAGNEVVANKYRSSAERDISEEAAFLTNDEAHAKATGIEQIYGTVRGGRVAGVDARLFDSRTAFGYLILRSQRGVVVLRVDLYGQVGTRMVRMEAVEVGSGDQPSGMLNAAERNSNQNSITRRHGTERKTFTLEYGDG